MSTESRRPPPNLSSSSAADKSLKSPASRRWRQSIASVSRWLHIYLSMFGFATILFFSVTGITLNHPAWFGLSTERIVEHTGKVEPRWLKGETEGDVDAIDKLAIAEFLRSKHQLRGAVTDFRIDDLECAVTWKGPGYAADAVIDREQHEYRLSVVEHGFVPLINDLHKGRDTGRVWSLVIDVSALLMTISAVTGLILLLYIRRKLVPGLITAAVGFAVLVALYVWGVP